MTSDRLTEQELEAAVRETFSTLDARRTVKGPFIPGSGSQLRADDRDWPPTPVSAIAWDGLSVAWENLQAIRCHIDVPPEQVNIFSIAHPTLCRAALIGAATAVWVLAPDDLATRIARARCVATDRLTEHAKALRARLEVGPDDGAQAVLEHVELRLAQMQAKREADGQRMTLETTKVVREAAAAAFGAPSYGLEAVWVWRSTSAAAHGLPHHLLGTPGTVQTTPADEHGVAAFVAAPSIGRYANPYMAAYRLAERGWALLKRRGL